MAFHFCGRLALLLLLGTGALPVLSISLQVPRHLSPPAIIPAPREALVAAASDRNGNGPIPGNTPGTGGVLPGANEDSPGHGTTHHSIFHLHASAVDSSVFWSILAGMIVFIISIDRIITVADWYAEDKRMMQKFLQRTYAELMMFGVVAISLFIFTNFAPMGEDTHLIFEFVDILVSLGACGMIFIALTFFLTAARSARVWDQMENGDGDVSNTVMNQTRQQDFAVMSSTFKKNMHLKDNFEYDEYLNECLCNHLSDVMSVTWYTWLAFLIFPVIGFVSRWNRGASLTDTQLLQDFGYVGWLTFAAHASFLAWIQYMHVGLRNSLAGADKTVTVTANMLGAAGFGLQFLSLMNAFLIAFFVMCGIYNDVNLKDTFRWTVSEALPLVLNTLVIYPVMLTRSTVLFAFCAPSMEAIGQVVEQVHRAAEDAAHLRKHWLEKGSPDLSGFEEMTHEEFEQVLDNMKFYGSNDRKRRLFNYMDDDKNGTISKRELYDVMREDFTPRPKQSATQRAEGSKYSEAEGTIHDIVREVTR